MTSFRVTVTRPDDVYVTTTTTSPTSTVIAARVPTELADEVRQHAAYNGLTVSKLLADSVIRALSLANATNATLGTNP